ncbi:sensor histidine kinase [Streptomyces sp. SP18CS02]|uniref:sensor histidine kinase n=1 Tax=Streptomyces sp. SP18CS02 TaxID=3002531 RepID=UPI002E771B04|nr:nitrate- and nitrite sensing domain-containing protein [Streptomyces sp. SP18CS02]MEE1752166.1 nitrate- and nitrite sensing domain-containing protein [Streptomyces sp. SP18CS02]
MRLRTLLIWLAVVPTLAMSAQVAVTADRLLAQSGHLRADVASGERIGVPLYKLMVDLQAERATTAERWAGSPVPEFELLNRRAATDRAVAEFLRSSATGPAGEETNRHLLGVRNGLEDLDAHRERADARAGGADRTTAYYTGLIGQMIRVYQEEFSHTEDAEVTEDSRLVVSLFSASEMLAREDTILASAGPSGELPAHAVTEFVDAVGAHRYLYDAWVTPYLSAEDARYYARITGSDAWKTKTRIENAVVSDHEDGDSGVKLPEEVTDWRTAQSTFAARLGTLNEDRARALLARGDAKASEIEAEVTWLVAGSSGALLLVALVVALTTRSVLRRLRVLHERTVTIAERTVPDVVARLQRGQTVDADALPRPTGAQDEVGRISDAFARVVAVSVEGHRQLADERHGFGMFATGIASRTGNLVSRQLSLTEDLQDTFGHDEALLAQLMRSDQLTVGMRRQVENLLILAGGEIPDPHTEPMRVADLLREAAAEVEDFRRIERQALDEISVEPRVISQISHLLAELLDNATRFSPPRAKVVIRAELVSDGLSVEIEDRGPRVMPASYEEMNRRLHSAPPYAVLAENAHRLGLFVVGHLADQLGATVTLRRSVYGGTSAVVIIPKELLVPTGRELLRPPAPAVPEARVAPRAVTGPLAHAGSGPEPAALAPPVLEPAAVERDVLEPAAPAPSLPDLPAAAADRVDGGRPALAVRVRPELPSRRTPEPSREGLPPAPAVVRGTKERPALPERVPQTHIAEQLREPRAPETPVVQDTATPEEVADAWADYEDGTQKVEQELRQDQP